MAFNRNPPLNEERVKNLQAEIDAFIDEKAKEVAKDSPGVPLGVVRSLLTSKAVGCQCRQYLEMTKQDDAA